MSDIEQMYELAKMQAQTDGAFSEELTRAWFDAAFDICAEMIGFSPAQQIREPLFIDLQGNFVLSHRPSSTVEIFEGYKLITILPRPLDRKISCCATYLCCLCHPYARYTVGQEVGCGGFSPRFVQAVCRVFTYILENRGDSELDREVLAKCGALTFLGPELQYVA